MSPVAVEYLEGLLMAFGFGLGFGLLVNAIRRFMDHI